MRFGLRISAGIAMRDGMAATAQIQAAGVAMITAEDGCVRVFQLQSPKLLRLIVPVEQDPGGRKLGLWTRINESANLKRGNSGQFINPVVTYEYPAGFVCLAMSPEKI